MIKNQLDLKFIAHHDVLTQLPNRLLLADRLSQAIANANRNNDKFAVCFIDLDGFKPINDNYGHATGDQILCEISRRIKKIIRENDTVARVGGDEFVVLFNEYKAYDKSSTLLDRLKEEISLPINLAGNTHQVTASIGVAIYPDSATEPDDLLEFSDKAMYQAKNAGKSRYHFYNQSAILNRLTNRSLSYI